MGWFDSKREQRQEANTRRLKIVNGLTGLRRQATSDAGRKLITNELEDIKRRSYKRIPQKVDTYLEHFRTEMARADLEAYQQHTEQRQHRSMNIGLP